MEALQNRWCAILMKAPAQYGAVATSPETLPEISPEIEHTLEMLRGFLTYLVTSAIARNHATSRQFVASLEAIGKRDFAANQVVDVNVIDVQDVGGKLWPIRLRERIRAAGPTMEYAAGYQPADAAFIAV